MDCSPSGSSVHRDSPGKIAGVGCHAFLQAIFPTQGLNLGLLHYRQILFHLSHQGSPSQPWIGRAGAWSSNALATWWEKPTHWKRPWCWERLKAKGEGGNRMRWLVSITNSMDMNLSKLWEIVEGRGDQCAAVLGVTKHWTWLSDWTTAKPYDSPIWSVQFSGF